MQLFLPTRALAGVAVAVLVVQGAGIALGAGSALAATATTRTTIATVHPVAGAATTLTAAVSPKPSGGTVAFADAGKSLAGCTKAVVRSGKATCRVTFTAGSHAVTARYSGKVGAYKPSTGTVTLNVAAAPAPPAPGTVVGSVGSCTTAKGALVAVDFAHWSGPIVRGCGTTLTTGRALLTAGGFAITGTQRFPGFICRLGHTLFNSGTPYPTPAQDACVNTPPANAYWSFWTAAKGVNTWTYSPSGADSDAPANGEVEAWTFGATDISGTTGKPTFTPAQVRAGLPAGTPATAARSLRALAATQSGAAPNIDKGAQYLVDQLSDGTHYEPFVGFADLGLTIDGAFSLAAAGFDTRLSAVSDYVRVHQDDFTYLSRYNGVYASGGAVGKVALLAEVTGGDPRNYGGVDLIKALHHLTCTKADAVRQCAGKGNYAMSSSVFSQALAVLAQLRASDASGAAEPIAYLESLQESSGGFPSLIGVSGSSAETDSTAMAAMALVLVPGARARGAVTRALKWLGGQQLSDGGFPGAAGHSVNSAALAVQALHLDAEKYRDEIAAAEAFLAAAQNSDGGFDVAAGADGSDLRASAQAVSGAAGIPFGSLLDDVGAKSAADAGATYLVSQLVDGNHYESSGYADYGLTADGLFALVGARDHGADVRKMTDYLKSSVDDYADISAHYGGPYSGGLAKLALVAEATGGNPHNFGGTDLLQVLASHVCTTAAKDATCTAPGDFVSSYSAVSQALGVLALQASPVSDDHLSATSPEVVRLHQLQCADGGFSSELIAPGTKCTSEVDTTGYAVQALAAVPNTDAWLGKAQQYLQKAQRPRGLYHGAAGDNSNSTALAAQALQTLVTALYSATVDRPGPKTTAPIGAWQSALRGLRGLAVGSGGFGLTSGATADLRASTQAVAAAVQRSLLVVSGAQIRSAPRLAATSDAPSDGGSSGSLSGRGSSSAGRAAPAGTGAPIATRPADTGVATGNQIALAMLLLLVGAGLLYAGRRRVVALAGRHRSG